MRPISVTVGALATADADGICASQRHGGAFGFAINGLLSSGFDADAICLDQAVGSATTLTINGALANSGQARLGNLPGKYVTITSAGDDSGITFTVAGINYGPQGQYAVTEVVTGTNASVVATTKLFYIVTSVTSSAAAAGNVSVGINGTWTADKPREIIFTPAGAESGITFTITGTDWNGNPASQTVTGVDNPSTAVSVVNFATITSITTSASTTSTVTVGTDGVAVSRPVFMDNFAFAPVGLQVDVTGTVNYTVQSTMDDILSVGIANATWLDSTDSAVVGATATKSSTFIYIPQAIRAKLNSGTGSITMTVNQPANVPF